MNINALTEYYKRWGDVTGFKNEYCLIKYSKIYQSLEDPTILNYTSCWMIVRSNQISNISSVGL